MAKVITVVSRIAVMSENRTITYGIICWLIILTNGSTRCSRILTCVSSRLSSSTAIVIIRCVIMPIASLTGVASVRLSLICIVLLQHPMSVSSSTRVPHGKKRAVEVDLDAKHSVRPEELTVVPPAPVPSSSVPVGDSTAICALAKRVNVCLAGVRVLKAVQGRRSVTTLTLSASRTALVNLMDIDEALLAQARTRTDEWFGSARISNVDEFFRASTATDRMSGVVAKFSLDVSRSGRSPPLVAHEGDLLDVTLQLVGIRFLRQHVDVLWRFVSSTPSSASTASTADDRDRDRDEEDAISVGPTPEERERMFVDLISRIDAERNVAEIRCRELDGLADALEDGQDSLDAAVLERVSERLDVMTMQVAGQTCTPDTSCCS